MNILQQGNMLICFKHSKTVLYYLTQGPRYLWHIDGYDKLKPYGFSIHGCIDG